MSISIYFPCFIYFFRVWGVNWIDSGDACTSQEQYGDLLFWLSSCYGAVHYWFHFSSLLLPLTFAFASYLFLLSRSLFPSSSSLLALIEKQQVVFNIISSLRESSYSRLLMSLGYFAIWHHCHLQNAFVLVLLKPWIVLSACFIHIKWIWIPFWIFHQAVSHSSELRIIWLNIKSLLSSSARLSKLSCYVYFRTNDLNKMTSQPTFKQIQVI